MTSASLDVMNVNTGLHHVVFTWNKTLQTLFYVDNDEVLSIAGLLAFFSVKNKIEQLFTSRP